MARSGLGFDQGCFSCSVCSEFQTYLKEGRKEIREEGRKGCFSYSDFLTDKLRELIGANVDGENNFGQLRLKLNF